MALLRGHERERLLDAMRMVAPVPSSGSDSIMTQAAKSHIMGLKMMDKSQ